MKPEISIIIATKNRPDFLYRCLLAIWKSDFKNFECIVVGDHCDYSQAVMNDVPFVHDPRFKYFNNTTIQAWNVGAIAKNMGIANASTNKICYCDDDNIVLPNHLSTLVQLDCDVAYSLYFEVSHGDASIKSILEKPLYFHSSDLGYKDALVMCHTKDIWWQVGGWKTMAELDTRSEDGDFMYRVNVASDRSQKFEVPTAIYHQHEMSMHDKDGTDYGDALKQLNGRVYVYPELVNKLKKEHGLN